MCSSGTTSKKSKRLTAAGNNDSSEKNGDGSSLHCHNFNDSPRVRRQKQSSPTTVTVPKVNRAKQVSFSVSSSFRTCWWWWLIIAVFLLFFFLLGAGRGGRVVCSWHGRRHQNTHIKGKILSFSPPIFAMIRI
jgi:hypothetical protein